MYNILYIITPITPWPFGSSRVIVSPHKRGSFCPPARPAKGCGMGGAIVAARTAVAHLTVRRLRMFRPLGVEYTINAGPKKSA